MRHSMLYVILLAGWLVAQSSVAQDVAHVFAELRLKGGDATEIKFDAHAPGEGNDAILALKARVDFEKPAGCNAALGLVLNGTPVAARRMINKPQRALSRGGDVYSLGAGERLVLFYSPDFTAPDNDPHYGLAEGYPSCYFELRVTDLLVAGTNTLAISNGASKDYTLVAAEATIAYRPAGGAGDATAVAPTGDLPLIEPAREHVGTFDVATGENGTLAVSVGGERFELSSFYSTPTPAWVSQGNEYFALQRRVERVGGAVVIHDTLTNKRSEPLPLMHQVEFAMGAKAKRVWLGGLLQPDLAGRTNAPMNPTVCVATEKAGIGLLPVDDVLRVHAAAFVEGGKAGLEDTQLVLTPGATYERAWAMIAGKSLDYWGFINAARRLLDVNFTIDGGFAFLRNGPMTDEWSDQKLSDFLRFKDPKYVCASIAYPFYNGTYTHGTSFQRIALDSYNTSFARWRKLAPERKYIVYFHCFIDVVEDGPTLFADARQLDAAGQHVDYGDPVDKLYVPLANNSFGPAVAKNVDLILDKIGADGVYWDEQEYSRYFYQYAEPWDGFSGDIDPKSMKVTRLKSNVTLLTEPWRLELAKKILQRGVLVANGPCLTKARRDLHFPCFVETGSISNCAQAHLYTPIALGDHLTERSEEDAYGVMLAALDFGCVYHWYNDMTVLPTHPHLTSYMFPITPIELHEGYIIGKERIITNRSGLFGWGDASAHEVHVFDATGRETTEHAGKPVDRDGKHYTELRIPKGWSASIVRR